MKSKLSIGLTLMLVALVLSFIPAAGITTQRVSAASTCDWAQFIADVTVPDGTSFNAGATFNKTWRLKNIGTCTWTTSYALVFDTGQQMGAPVSINFPGSVAPGQTVDLTLNMTVPSAPGHYIGYWKFKNASGVLFGIGWTANKSWWVDINVSGGYGVFYDFTSNLCQANWYNDTALLPCPGTDGSVDGFALKLDNPVLENNVPALNPGILTSPQQIYNGVVYSVYPAMQILPGDIFQATVGCQNGAVSCYARYFLQYKTAGGNVYTLWTWNEKYEGLSYNASINLNALAGQNVSLILGIRAYGSPTGDRALWIHPVIVRPGAVPATPVPITPGPITPLPAACDRAQFIADVTVPDGTVFSPNAPFIKTWRIKNVGTCTWSTSYSLIFASGDKMGGPDSAALPNSVAPGQTVDLTINLTSPSSAGSYRGYWRFKNASGVPFGIGTDGTKSWWVDIKVTGPIATPTVSPTPGGPTSTPVAGTVYDFASNACSAAWYSGAGALPCPGTDGDPKGFVLKIANPRLENGTTDIRPGLLTFPQNIYNGYIQGIYPSYHVNAGDRFRSIVNCEYNATSCYVVFRLDYLVGTGTNITTYWAFVEKYDGQYYSADLDLSPLVGQDVKFILTILSTGSPAGDRALWVAPMIFNPGGVATAIFTPTLTLTPMTTLTPSPTATPTITNTPSSTGYKYDFGTASSPLASGYSRVTETTTYSSGGFGWTDTSGLESRDRSALADDLKRDFVTNASAARTFKVDLPNGNYTVSITMGDNDYAHDNMVVKANGTTMLPSVSTVAGGFAVNSFSVTVSGGSLALEFSDNGGADPSWVVNGVSITP